MDFLQKKHGVDFSVKEQQSATTTAIVKGSNVDAVNIAVLHVKKQIDEEHIARIGMLLEIQHTSSRYHCIFGLIKICTKFDFFASTR